MLAADKAGIAGCIPAHNFRKIEDLKSCLKVLKDQCQYDFGVNLIVNRSNLVLKDQLEACLEFAVPFVITSLGSPEECIKKLKPMGTKVFCDVVDEKYARKVEELGADAVIAVNSGAGGHAGKIPASVLVPMLTKSLKIPVISAGGVGDSKGVRSMLDLGATALSIGSPFIASKESGVTEDYKQACVDFGAKDIVMTAKISGSPCTVIQNDYVKSIGTEQNAVERFLNNNRKVKKWAKAVTFYKGMKLLEKAAFSATYKSVWCAGPSIEFTKKIESIQEIVDRLVKDGPLKNEVE